MHKDELIVIIVSGFLLGTIYRIFGTEGVVCFTGGLIYSVALFEYARYNHQ